MSNWKMEWSDKYMNCNGVVYDSGSGEFLVKGSVKSVTSNPTIMFIAPNPPTYVTSFSGSGLPYPNPEVAYENTPNRGSVVAIDRNFQFKIRYPNAYYVALGSVYVEPCVHIRVCENGLAGELQTIRLGKGIPYRSLTYPPTTPNVKPRSSPLFYSGLEDLPIRSQEQILREADYPRENIMPDNFWGTKPPM